VDALEKSREIGQKDATVISLGNLGILYELRGRFSAALSSFDEALGIAGGMNFAAARTEFTLKKAGLLQGLGRGDEAGALLAQAEKWVAATGNREQQADLEVLRGQWNLARGDAAAARAAFDRAQPLARESGSRVSLLRARLARACAQAETAGGIAEVGAVLREAESLGQTAVTLEASEDLGRAELSRRRFPDADRVLQKAIGIAEPAGWNEGLFRLYALRARALEASGRRAEAAGEIAKSSREIARLRENVPAQMRASFDALPTVREVLAR
jgi:tetratricopeptide (TPR) repeat protein